MADALAPAEPVSLFDPLSLVGQFEQASTADMVMPRLDGLQNLGLLCEIEAILGDESA